MNCLMEFFVLCVCCLIDEGVGVDVDVCVMMNDGFLCVGNFVMIVFFDLMC